MTASETPASLCSPAFSLRGKRVWVAGHGGLVGSAVVRRLGRELCEVVTAPRAELDLRDAAALDAWMAVHRPQVMIVAAARVGGIAANLLAPADFLRDNLLIAAHAVEAARRFGVEKTLLLGSSCIYPRDAAQPTPESALLSGPLEPSNAAYAVAKIAALQLGQAYRRQHGLDVVSAMPTNLYGPGDNFDLATAHVLPALVRKVHEARRAGAEALEVWGTGAPRREFLHVDDLADACVHLLQAYSDEAPVNVGSGEEVTIAELARMVARVAGYDGRLVFDPSRPDGAPRKRLDLRRMDALGWRARIPLEAGLRSTYGWYVESRRSRGPP